MRVPEPKIEIDLQPLQLLLTFEDENQRDISAEKFLLLDRWIESVKKSHLFPVIRNRYLKIHMRGHASKTDTPFKNQDLSIQRRKNVQNRLEAMRDAAVEVVPYDRGSDPQLESARLPPSARRARRCRERRAAMLENRAVRTSRPGVELRVLRRMIRNVVPEQAKQARARAVFLRLQSKRPISMDEYG